MRATMKNLIALSGFLLLLVMTSGCASRTVPATRAMKTPIGEFHFPKDVHLKGLTMQFIGTNTIIQVQEYISRNNPEVIDSAAAGQAMILERGINATGGAIGNAMAAYHKGMMPVAAPQPQPAPQPTPKPE